MGKVRHFAAAVGALSLSALVGCASTTPAMQVASPLPAAALAPAPAPAPSPASASREGLVLADAVPANELTEARDPSEPGVVPPLQPAPRNAETPSQRQSRRFRRALGWTLLGVGGEGLLLAVPTSIILLDKKHRLDQECSAQKLCSQSGVNDANSFTALTPINTASWVTAIVGGVAGAVLLITAPSEHARTAVVAVGPGSLGVAGTF